MGRWEPDASGRLSKAAMELYLDRGYEQTTVAEIAARAGVTPRTFFRYFADKREVLFGGADVFQEHLVAALRNAPPTASPMQAVGAGLAAAGELLADREFAGQRSAVINRNTELQERELIKMASLAEAFAEALRARGVGGPEAVLVAQTGVAVFRVAFDRWLGDPGERSLAAVIEESFDDLASAAMPSRRSTTQR